MKPISAAVLELTPEELAQAAFFHLKQLRERKNVTIPKPITGTLRKDGTPRKIIYQGTRHESAGETQIYLHKRFNRIEEITYTKDPVTGQITRSSVYKPKK